MTFRLVRRYLNPDTGSYTLFADNLFVDNWSSKEMKAIIGEYRETFDMTVVEDPTGHRLEDLSTEYYQYNGCLFCKRKVDRLFPGLKVNTCYRVVVT